MKRIMYISTLASTLPDREIRSIGRTASQNNRRIGVTGVLLFAHEFFFQILEGEPETIDRLIEVIRRDRRHRDLLILKVERDITERLFPNWSMRTIRLEETQGMILQAVRMMLENITQSHRIIERYTQPTVLRMLTQGINPLEISAKKAERVILFGDMVGFSRLSHKFQVDEITDVVNAYLDICSRRVTEFGGEVSKYIGDCVMAHFPSGHADAAIEACLAILGDLRDFRRSQKGSRLAGLLFGGFGLAAGWVIEGNIGSTIKMDYTVMGDPVNLAARLEALTRTIQRAIALSEVVRHCTTRPWPFECVGEFQLKGQEHPHCVYSLHDPLVYDFKDQLELAVAMQSINEPWAHD